MNPRPGHPLAYRLLWLILVPLALILFLSPPAEPATPPVLSGGAHYALAPDASSLTTGDFDGEGAPDVAVADSGAVSLWLNDGHGGLFFSGRLLQGRGVTQVLAADFDRDGRADLAVLAESLLVLRSLGGGAFTPPAGYRTGARPAAVAAGDLDRDGTADLVVADLLDGTVSVLLGDGAGGFGAPDAYPALAYPVAVAIVDVDRDARLDVVVTRYSSDQAVLRNLGGGRLAPPAVFSGCIHNGTSLFAGDLDGDGTPDLARTGWHMLGILWNDGAGAFPTCTALPWGDWIEAGVVGADLDQDGRTDLVVAGRSWLALLHNQGGRTFGTGCDWWISPSDRLWHFEDQFPGAGAAVPTDLDRDGTDDFVVLERGLARMTVLRHLRGGVYDAVTAWLPGDVEGVTALDLDRDGNRDLLALHEGRLRLLRGRGDGTFGNRQDLGLLTHRARLRAADLDGDGHDDLLAASGNARSSPGDTIWTALSRAGGGLGPLAMDAGWQFLCLGDPGRDGRSDLIVRQGDVLAVRANDGSGHFGLPVPIPVHLTGVTDGVAAGDFDGDGWDDLAVVHGLTCELDWGVGWRYECRDSLTVLVNDRSGGFAPAIRFTHSWDDWQGRPWREAVARDLDGDGDLDLALLYADNGNTHGPIFVLLNDGHGGFTLAGRYDSDGEEANSLCVADLTGDARPELAWISRDGNGNGLLSVLTNQGEGTFDPRACGHGLPCYPTALAAADLDHDGRTDLVATTMGSSGNPSARGGVLTFLNLTPQAVTPVRISLVEARVVNGVVHLRWYSAGPLPSARVERREDAGSWNAMGEVHADDAGMLVFEDRAAVPGTSYGYRLRYGAGAAAESSAEVLITVPAVGLAIERLRPNPVTHEAAVSFVLPGFDPAALTLVDVGGRRVLTRPLERPSPGPGTVSLAIPATLRAGVYWLELRQGGQTVTTRTVIVR